MNFLRIRKNPVAPAIPICNNPLMQFLNRIRWLTLAVALPACPLANASTEPDLPVYIDGLTSGFIDWASAPHNVTNTSPVHSGNYSISVSPSGWEGLHLHHGNMDTTPYLNLSFWIHGDTNGGQLIQVRALLGTNVGSQYPLPPLESDKWQMITIPLASLDAADASNFCGFWIQRCGSNSPDGTFYVDDIQLDAKPGPLPALAAVSEAPAAPSAKTLVAPSTPAPASGPNSTVWILCALIITIALLAWLVIALLASLGFLLKRNASRMLASSSAPTGLLSEGGPSRDAVEPALATDWRERALAAEAVADKQAQIIRDELVPELTEFAKQSLVQGLSSQRKALLETHQKAQAELAKLEARLTELRLPLRERILMFEKRIAELENELLTRGEEMSELIRATLLLVRQRLDEERQKDITSSRSN